MQRRSWFLVAAMLAPLAVGLALWFGPFEGRPSGEVVASGPPSSRGTSATAELDPRPVPPASTAFEPTLAPAGFLLRDSDALPGSDLTLLYRGSEGPSRLCRVGTDSGGQALSVAYCHDLTGLRSGQMDLDEVAPEGVPEIHAVVGGNLLWLWPQSGGADRLFNKPIDGVGAEVEIGEVPARSERIHGCLSEGALAVIVDGEIVHGDRQVAVTFREPQGWTPIVQATARITQYVTTCNSSQVSLTWVDAEGRADQWRVHRIMCTPEACDRQDVTVTPDGFDPMVAGVGDDTLLVRSVEGVARIRLAPLSVLADAEDLPVGPVAEPPVLSRHLFVRGDVAVLLERTPSGTRGVRIDHHGHVAVLPVREGRGGM